MNTDNLHMIDDIDMRLIPSELLDMVPGRSDSREDFRPRVEYNLARFVAEYRECMNNIWMRQSKEDEIFDLSQRIPQDVLLLPKVRASLIMFHALVLQTVDPTK